TAYLKCGDEARVDKRSSPPYNYELARDACQKAIELDPKNARGYGTLVIIYFRILRYCPELKLDKVKDTSWKALILKNAALAIQAAPEYSSYYSYLADLFEQVGHINIHYQIANLAKAFELGPEGERAYFKSLEN